MGGGAVPCPDRRRDRHRHHRCVKEIRDGGKAVGTVCRDGEHARQLIDKGVTYLAGSVGGMLGGALKSYVRTARGD